MTPKNVRSRRIRLGLSVEELARALEVPVATLSKFEAGEATLRDPEQARSVLDRLERDFRRCGAP